MLAWGQTADWIQRVNVWAHALGRLAPSRITTRLRALHASELGVSEERHTGVRFLTGSITT